MNKKYLLAIILAASIVTSCANHQKSSIANHPQTPQTELQFLKSNHVLDAELKNIWNCLFVSVGKSEQNWNGKITNRITVLITDTQKKYPEGIDNCIAPTLELLKNNVINYKQFPEIDIIYSFTSENGEILNGKRVFLTEKI